jgi:aminoglycoside/choline kinase family phosphotransferase
VIGFGIDLETGVKHGYGGLAEVRYGRRGRRPYLLTKEMRKLIHYLKSTLPAVFSYTGRIPIHCLKGDGSDRKVYRVKWGRKSSILVDHPGGRKGAPSENDSFNYIGWHLASKEIHTPNIIDYHRGLGIFLLEDFGDVTLEERIRMPNIDILMTYKEIVKHLVSIQVKGSLGFDPSRCYDTPVYDGLFSWERETLYFVRSFLQGYLGWGKVDQALLDELREIALRVDREKSRFFLYRDFQSRNIMVLADGFGFIDFQGGRLGPPQYDLASLLIDPYVKLCMSMKDKLIALYIQELSKVISINTFCFLEHYGIIGFQRNLQILGAYSFLSRVRRKTYFETYIPAAVETLKEWVKNDIFKPYRHTRKIIKEL